MLALVSLLAAAVARLLGAKHCEPFGPSADFYVAPKGSSLARLALGRFSAITFGKTVIFASADAFLDDHVRRHELVHVAQWKRVGALKFIVQYLGDYIRARRAGQRHFLAYRSIRFEEEAYLCESDPRFPNLP